MERKGFRLNILTINNFMLKSLQKEEDRKMDNQTSEMKKLQEEISNLKVQLEDANFKIFALEQGLKVLNAARPNVARPSDTDMRYLVNLLKANAKENQDQWWSLIIIIKIVRILTKWSLKESKDYVHSVII